MSWRALEREQPERVAFGYGRLRGKAAHLATVRKDGGARQPYPLPSPSSGERRWGGAMRGIERGRGGVLDEAREARDCEALERVSMGGGGALVVCWIL